MPLVKELTTKNIDVLDLEKNFKSACVDKDFVALVKNLKLEPKVAIKMTSKLQRAIEAEKECQNCKGFFMCKHAYPGHLEVPKRKDKKVYFTYVPCKYQKQVFEKEEKLNKKIYIKDIDTQDKKQLEIIKWMDQFYETYDVSRNKKGLYLHGSFGSGKTYLLTALLNELEINKNVSIEIVYFPEALRSLKEDFDAFGYKMHRYMTVNILLLDDIGAENVTEWGRDDVLGTILQTRMDKKKTTFFTSNLSITELEQNLSISKTSVDKVKARRIIERIKQLTKDMELISENRRK